jgi:hypothetical protein
MDGNGKAQAALAGDPAYTLQAYWPERAIIVDYCIGIGARDEVAAPFYQNALPAATHQASGVQAVIGASHMQFVIPREVARRAVPLPATRGLLRTETMSLDFNIDALGYLHLSTPQPHVFHMGNTISDRLRQELKAMRAGFPAAASAAAPQPAQPRRPRSRLGRLLSRLAANPRFQPYLLRLYHLLFQALYAEKRESRVENREP